MRGFLFYAALAFVAPLWDWWWNRTLGVGPFAPGWLFVLTLAVAAGEGPIPAQVLGLLWGIWQDLLAVHLFGANVLGLGLAAYLVGRGRRLLDLSTAPSQAVVTALLTLAYQLFIGVLGTVFMGRFMGPGVWGAVAVPIANGLAAPFVFSLLRRRRPG